MTQREALDILKTGRNVFLTGAAGSGKTHTLREYISYLKGINASVAITASTGIAATHMGGMTIHSWSGIGIKDFLRPHELDAIVERPHIRNRIRNTSVLIIDEVSMLHHFRLDLIDTILKHARASIAPFGGVQVVLCGDFFQLPPIERNRPQGETLNTNFRGLTFDNEEPPTFALKESYGEAKKKFAYHSKSWSDLGLKICYLSEQHRQDDQKYLKVLNSIRDNKVEEAVVEILNGRIGAAVNHSTPTRLYSHNVDVDNENEKELEKLKGEIFSYEMKDRGARMLIKSLKKSCLAPEVLNLKKGAKVMFVKNNFEEGFVNGTQGTVVFLNRDHITVKTLSGKMIDVPFESWRIEEDGRMKAEIAQFPLRLAWAITVHKSQGMSLEAAEVDLRDCFEKGMGYVALSRVCSLNGLSLKGFNQIALCVDEEVLDFDKGLRELSQKNRIQIKKLGEKLSDLQKEFKNKISQSGNKKKEKIDTVSVTKILFEEGKTLEEIAKERKLTEGTILSHLEKIKEEDPTFNIYPLHESLSGAKFQKIYSAFQKIGASNNGKRPLAPVKELLGDKFSYDELKLVRLFL